MGPTMKPLYRIHALLDKQYCRPTVAHVAKVAVGFDRASSNVLNCVLVRDGNASQTWLVVKIMLLFWVPKYQVPYYSKDPKRDRNFATSHVVLEQCHRFVPSWT